MKDPNERDDIFEGYGDYDEEYSGVYHRYYIWIDQPEPEYRDEDMFSEYGPVGRGPVVVEWSTNDNLDIGFPSERGSLTMRFRTLKEAVENSGGTRRGCMGAKVEVYLNGEVLTEEAAQAILEKENRND
jgi:hypothetical protein